MKKTTALKGKAKRWRKGHSSSSNPETKKHREAAKGRFLNTLSSTAGMVWYGDHGGMMMMTMLFVYHYVHALGDCCCSVWCGCCVFVFIRDGWFIGIL